MVLVDTLFEYMLNWPVLQYSRLVSVFSSWH